MAFKYACFLSFPDKAGIATDFAQDFYTSLQAQLLGYGKREMTIFKYDQAEHTRTDDDWQRWIGDKLCQSAMMVAVCAPTYFNDSPACVSEFDGMELLLQQRQQWLALTDGFRPDWIIALRLYQDVPLPRLNQGYHVVDFFEYRCDRNALQQKPYTTRVMELADRIYRHWQWVKNHPDLAALQQARLCEKFRLQPPAGVPDGDLFPSAGGVR